MREGRKEERRECEGFFVPQVFKKHTEEKCLKAN